MNLHAWKNLIMKKVGVEAKNFKDLIKKAEQKNIMAYWLLFVTKLESSKVNFYLKRLIFKLNGTTKNTV